MFAFRGRRAGLIKLIWHDGVGLCMLTKRLEQGQFVWPSAEHDRPDRAVRAAIGGAARRMRVASAGAAPQAGARRIKSMLSAATNSGLDATASFIIAAVQIDPDTLPDDPRAAADAADGAAAGELHAENDKLRLLIQRLTRHQFGRRSEQLTAEQLQLGLEDLEQTSRRATRRRRTRRSRGWPTAQAARRSRPPAIMARCPPICRATRW